MEPQKPRIKPTDVTPAGSSKSFVYPHQKPSGKEIEGKVKDYLLPELLKEIKADEDNRGVSRGGGV